MQTRNYGRVRDVIEVPDLREIQVRSYRRFLQLGVPAHLRDNVGLEKALRETFPIESLDRTMVLEYLGYELAPPKHTPDECRKLRLTYGNPLRVRVRLVRPGHDAIEEPVFLGEMPRMVGGGEFIVNGVDRVIVSQLHRSPGVDFTEDRSTGDRVRYGARVIPERGSWLDFEVDRKDVLRVRIDQSPRLPATLLLRCFGRETSRTEDLLRIFYESRRVDLADPGALQEVEHAVAVTRLVDPHSGELLVEAGEEISSHKAQQLRTLGFETVEVIPATAVHDRLVLNTIAAEGPVEGYEDALLRLYRQLRPGYPADFEKARKAFEQRFRDPSRYSLGRVGRFRIQRKFGRPPAPDTEQALLLQPEDVIDTIRYIVGLRTQRGGGEQRYFVDDIDHLGNRRVRTVGELAEQELRKGLLRLKRTAQERMSLLDPDKHELTPRTILQYRTVAGAIEAFFGRGELSQVVDQTNPLAQLTHERRLSALGPGGLNRKRAGFEVRDVHISHYGRICPIETPEGTNIGLINSLA
ncbi:MAG: DNA-directed RNA polymerase subunit beta, partial [Planctomycetota bacterium]